MTITGKGYKMLKRNTLRFFREFDKFTNIVENQLPAGLTEEDDVKYTMYAISNEIKSQFSRYNLFVNDMYGLEPHHKRRVMYIDIYVDSAKTKNGIFKLLPGMEMRKMIFSENLDINFTVHTHTWFFEKEMGLNG